LTFGQTPGAGHPFRPRHLFRQEGANISPERQLTGTDDSRQSCCAAAGVAQGRLRNGKEAVMADLDRDYFYRRAEEEIAVAQASASEPLVRFHYQLASLYLDRVFGADGDPRALPLPV